MRYLYKRIVLSSAILMILALGCGTTKEEKWTLEDATTYFEEALLKETDSSIIKMYVDEFSDDGKYYAFALTGPADMLPYDVNDARDFVKDTEIWFLSKEKVEKMEYHISTGDIPYNMDTYIFKNGKKLVCASTWFSNYDDNNIFYTVKDGGYVELENIQGSLWLSDDGTLINYCSQYTQDGWITESCIVNYDGEKFIYETISDIE